MTGVEKELAVEHYPVPYFENKQFVRNECVCGHRGPWREHIRSHTQALVERREDALIRECNDAWIQEIGPYLHVPYGFDLNCILKGVRERLASLSKPAPVERSNENG